MQQAQCDGQSWLQHGQSPHSASRATITVPQNRQHMMPSRHQRSRDPSARRSEPPGHCATHRGGALQDGALQLDAFAPMMPASRSRLHPARLSSRQTSLQLHWPSCRAYATLVPLRSRCIGEGGSGDVNRCRRGALVLRRHGSRPAARHRGGRRARRLGNSRCTAQGVQQTFSSGVAGPVSW